MDSVTLLARLDAAQAALDAFRAQLVGGDAALPIVEAFIRDRCVTGPNHRASASALIGAFDDYITLADTSAVQLPGSAKALCIEFAKLARRKRTSSGTVYCGIALK